MNNHQIAEAGGKLAVHTMTVIAGLAMIVAGLGLSVTMVGLPLGVPLGLAGVLVCLWGIAGTMPGKPAAPPRA